MFDHMPCASLGRGVKRWNSIGGIYVSFKVYFMIRGWLSKWYVTFIDCVTKKKNDWASPFATMKALEHANSTEWRRNLVMGSRHAKVRHRAGKFLRAHEGAWSHGRGGHTGPICYHAQFNESNAASFRIILWMSRIYPQSRGTWMRFQPNLLLLLVFIADSDLVYSRSRKLLSLEKLLQA